MNNKKEMTAPITSVDADEEQSNNKTNNIITDFDANCNAQDEIFQEMQEELRRNLDPLYLKTVSMNKLYDTVYDSRPPIIDGLLYPGTYLFVGAPKLGKSFLMAQLAYHISKGENLWGYDVKKGTVLYLALEDDYRRLQERFYRMFDEESTDNFGVCLLLVHHTRKQQADDKFDMISGTNGLLGAADGAFMLQKEKRTSNSAVLEISGRDQQDQKLHLVRDTEKLLWNLERAETQ